MASPGLTVPREHTADHRARLFDELDSLARHVALFLEDGIREGARLLVVARPRHSAAILEELANRGHASSALVQSGQLVVLDAAATMAKFFRGGRPDRARFDVAVAPLVADLIAHGTGLRIYGEIVDVLAEQGQLAAAQELERFWNALAGRQTFTLLCGYQSEHFGDRRSAAALHAICGLHDETSASPADMLGSWLLRERAHNHGSTV